MKLPRGIRNNNPGNIRISKTAWRGKKLENTDGDFEQFTSAYYGIRALVRVLRVYQTKHNLKTIAQIINRWAPPNENDTEAYANAVARVLDAEPDKEILIGENTTTERLVAAIIRHENGMQPYSAADIQAAIKAAIA